jgi:hypothetical protein
MVLSAILVLGVGCGSNSGGGGSGGGASNSQGFIDSYCAAIAPCCGQAKLPTNGTQCRQLFGLSALGGSYNAALGSACLDEAQAQVKDGTFCDNLGANNPSPCENVYASGNGSKKPGEKCNVDGDCAASNLGEVACSSVYVGGSSDGTFIHKCQILMPGKAGDTPCIATRDGNFLNEYLPSGATDVESQGYVCDIANGVTCEQGTCVALAAVGASCSMSSDCVRTAYCSFPQDKCAPKVALGQACSNVAGSECVDDAFCGEATKLCTARLPNGAACTSFRQCKSDSCTNGTCEADANFALALICGT